ncbi:MAG TPA: SRPBCC family protein [Candidatus Dormibacteraeota bacterium]|nr:SRPBCC family protein [Candidatus Dormibacteraeota bacterium]
MADATRSVETSASPQSVWRTWSDTSTWPSWNPDITYVKLEGDFASGTTGTMETKSGGKHNISLADVHQEREFTLISDVPMPATKVVFRCAIEPTAGGSRISQGVTVKGLFSFMAGAITGRIAPSFEPLLQGLKRHVEAGPAQA